MTARSVAVASSTASASSANSRSSYASDTVGRSERPLPRPSNVTTRKWRARYGICPFHCREWMIDHVGSRRMVRGPVPYTSKKTRTPSRSTYPDSSG